MPRTAIACLLASATLLAAAAATRAQEEPPPEPRPSVADASTESAVRALTESLAQVERDFAGAFADRDLERFASFLAADAVFLGPDGSALRGKAAIVEGWQDYFTGDPPFSWYPTVSEVSGDLGLSQGPVLSPKGDWLVNFSSVWRRQADGTWKIVFDGAPPCRSMAEPAPEAP